MIAPVTMTVEPAQAAAAPRIEVAVRGLGHDFRPMSSATPLTVLDGIDLDIARGEFVSLIGPSGCGKSTLLRLMSGLIAPSRGTIAVAGRQVRGLDRRLGFVFQQDAVFPWLTVEGNIAYGPRCRGVAGREREALVARWAEAVGLAQFRKAWPKELSGGMRKRVDLARVYANAPEILFMDEPFGALDVETKASMQHTVLDLWQRTGTTIVFVTHDLEEAVFLSDRVVVLSSRPGRIATIVPIDLPRPRNEASRLSDHFAAMKREVWSAMRSGHSPAAVPEVTTHG
jgi:NitT/TauT family transport system ATP-binding protein